MTLLECLKAINDSRSRHRRYRGDCAPPPTTRQRIRHFSFKLPTCPPAGTWSRKRAQ
jgi:hypothetical protein